MDLWCRMKFISWSLFPSSTHLFSELNLIEERSPTLNSDWSWDIPSVLPPSFSSSLDRIHSISSRKTNSFLLQNVYNISETLYKLISLNFPHNPEVIVTSTVQLKLLKDLTSSQWLNGNLILSFQSPHALQSATLLWALGEKKLVSPGLDQARIIVAVMYPGTYCNEKLVKVHKRL